MKDKIIDFLKRSNHNSFPLELIYEGILLNTEEEYKELEEALIALVEDGTLYHSVKKNKYCLLEDSHLLKGKLMLNKKGFGFVRVNGIEEDFYIKEDNINNALDDDIVIIEEVKKGKHEAKIIRTVSRQSDTIVGTVYFYNDKIYVKADKVEIRNPIYIENNYLNVVEGHKVVVKLDSNFNSKSYKGQIVKVIGHINDPGIDILTYVYQYGFDPNISDEVLEELKSIPGEVTESDINGRVDLRNEIIFTIDGDDTKDIDDAVSIKILENGNYELGVHIADVTHYVKEGSALDKSAYEKGNSVYLVDRVVPMLPHELSNGICSLNPNVDRLAISFIIEIDNHGNTINHKIFESVIKSRMQMTYNKVNDILDKGIIDEKYNDFVIHLQRMEVLANILRKRRVREGYIEFNSPEPKIIVDENGVPIDIKLRNQGTTERIIEHFMIISNQVVGNFFLKVGQPAIYRVHDKPVDMKLNNFISFIKSKGVQINIKKGSITPQEMQMIVSSIDGRSDSKILNDLAIRTQAKAVYSKDNIGHFALGINPKEGYCHITAPIRRYSDIVDYRLLKELWRHGNRPNTSYENTLMHTAVQCSKKEVDAVSCERDVEKMKKCEYMESHIGEVYTGLISGVQEFGLFIELENTVEGLLPIDTLPSDYYYLDEIGYTLYGKRTGAKYTMGDEIKVKVTNASKEECKIDFEIFKGE